MRIDLYIFREWVKIFTLAVGAILGLLLLSEIYNELPNFLERGAPPNQVLTFFLLLIPGYLPSLLPICFLLSLLFSLAALHRNGEIVAIRAAGISLFRLSRAYWIAAGLLALGLFWLNGSLAPSSVEKSRLIKEQVKEKELASTSDHIRGTTQDLAVAIPGTEELWFVEVYRRSSNEAFGVSVSLPQEDGQRVRYEAARATFDPKNEHWILEDGLIMNLSQGNGIPESLIQFDRIELTDSQMSPILLLGFSQRPKDLSLNQLAGLIQSTRDDPKIDPYRARYYSILSSPFQFFVVVLITLPCALGSGRSKASGSFFQAVWIYLGFFGVMTLFSLAGQRDILPALAAAWSPFAIATIAGIWMYRKNA
ncbi:MAG: LptF/LptG family permease [Puniceicoccales bacterium]